MLIHNYVYFLKIIEYGNISRAAESLYISQPSLTKYLQRLEDKVGAKLIDRDQTPIKLTTAGEYYYDYLLRAEAEVLKFESIIGEIVNEGRDSITIGMPLWRSSVILPEFLPYFLKKYPLITVHLHESGAAKLENALMKDEIDFGIMNLPVNYANLSHDIIIEEYIFLVGSRKNSIIRKILEDNPSVDYPHIDINNFTNEPFVLTKPGQHITSYVDRMLSRNKLELNCVFRTANVTTALNLAAANIGFTFVPEFGTKSKFFLNDLVALCTIDDPPLRCKLAAVYKKSKYLSNASKLFIEELKKFVSDSWVTDRGDVQ